jgi:hypothetical protein
MNKIDGKGGRKMSINNIFNCKIETVHTTGALHAGHTVNLNQTSHFKSLGFNRPIGDGGINVIGAENLYVDTDIVDSTRIRL